MKYKSVSINLFYGKDVYSIVLKIYSGSFNIYYTILQEKKSNSGSKINWQGSYIINLTYIVFFNTFYSTTCSFKVYK